MSELISTRMKSFNCKNIEEERQALREVIQDATLAGLWRGKFFEHAAFYGGTALRIFHGLDRFSEDLDFTLLRETANFQLKSYLNAVRQELTAIGFDVKIDSKKEGSAVESAFIKAETMQHLLLIKSPFKTHRSELLSVKLEIDTRPALGFSTEAKTLGWPFLFSTVCCDLPSLFSGKLHALICRERVHNVKGRDWYDLLWYFSRKIPFNKTYLQEKLRQSGVIAKEQILRVEDVLRLLEAKIDLLDIDSAKRDIARFIPQPSRLDGWSRDNFKLAIKGLSDLTSSQQ